LPVSCIRSSLKTEQPPTNALRWPIDGLGPRLIYKAGAAAPALRLMRSILRAIRSKPRSRC
jgi:hypothetical protein